MHRRRRLECWSVYVREKSGKNRKDFVFGLWPVSRILSPHSDVTAIDLLPFVHHPRSVGYGSLQGYSGAPQKYYCTNITREPRYSCRRLSHAFIGSISYIQLKCNPPPTSRSKILVYVSVSHKYSSLHTNTNENQSYLCLLRQ